MENAGFTIIAETHRPIDGTVEGIALGYKATQFGEEFVTWAFTERPREERSYFWGHYFRTEANAYIDYHERALRLWKE